jgi:hypothetical protein
MKKILTVLVLAATLGATTVQALPVLSTGTSSTPHKLAYSEDIPHWMTDLANWINGY